LPVERRTTVAQGDEIKLTFSRTRIQSQGKINVRYEWETSVIRGKDVIGTSTQRCNVSNYRIDRPPPPPWQKRTLSLSKPITWRIRTAQNNGGTSRVFAFCSSQNIRTS